MWREHQSKQANPRLRASGDSPSRSERKLDPSRAQEEFCSVLEESRAFARDTPGQSYLQRLLAESPEKGGSERRSGETGGQEAEAPRVEDGPPHPLAEVTDDPGPSCPHPRITQEAEVLLCPFSEASSEAK